MDLLPEMNILDSDDDLTRDKQRFEVKTLQTIDNGVSFVVFDDMHNGKEDENLRMMDVLKFNSPSLLKIKEIALNDATVDERRKIDLEKGSRGEKIYNEAVRYGAQAGLKATFDNFYMAISKMETELSTVYNFESMLIGRGKVIPPVVTISKGVTGLNKDSREMSFVDTRYSIIEQAKFSDQPLTIHSYLTLPLQTVKEPSIYSSPLDDVELTYWANGVYAGWTRGAAMAKDELDSKIARLNRDFFGMKRYTILAEQGILKSPIVNSYENDVVGHGNSMDVGQIKLRITVLPQFELNSNNWNVLPLLDKLEINQITEKND